MTVWCLTPALYSWRKSALVLGVMGPDPARFQVTEDQLRAIFQRFGEIVYVKIPAGKGCGFVQFMGRPNAEAAMLAMNGQVRCCWPAVTCCKLRCTRARICRWAAAALCNKFQ